MRPMERRQRPPRRPKRARRPMPAAAHRPGRRRRGKQPLAEKRQNAKAKAPPAKPWQPGTNLFCRRGADARGAAHRACARGKGRVACALRGRRRNGHPLWAHAGVCGSALGVLQNFVDLQLKQVDIIPDFTGEHKYRRYFYCKIQAIPFIIVTTGVWALVKLKAMHAV